MANETDTDVIALVMLKIARPELRNNFKQESNIICYTKTEYSLYES